MPSSPTQRGAEGKPAADEAVVDALVDDTAAEVEANACDVETPGADIDGSRNDDASLAAEVGACVEVTVDVRSSSDSDSTEISDKQLI